MTTPPGPPPSGEFTASSNTSKPSAVNGIDEHPLPPGWVSRIDKQSGHKYYIDTAVNPPRSIWHHPLEDDEYLDSLVPYEECSCGDDDSEDSHLHRCANRSTNPGELPPPEGSSAGTSNPHSANGTSNSNVSGFSGWVRRFGNGMEDNFRFRHGMQPKARDPQGTAYNAGPDVIVVGGRHGPGRMYVNDGVGYAYAGRRRRAGPIRTAIAAVKPEK